MTVSHVAAIATSAALAFACGDGTPTGGGGPPGPTAAVDVRDNFFSPQSTPLTVGGTVTWTWQGSNPHNVTFDPNDSPQSATQSAGTYVRQFQTAGTFTYYCTVHGRSMSGSVVVQ